MCVCECVCVSVLEVLSHIQDRPKTQAEPDHVVEVHDKPTNTVIGFRWEMSFAFRRARSRSSSIGRAWDCSVCMSLSVNPENMFQFS